MFDKEYFNRYRCKTWLSVLGIEKKKPFLWAYWKRQLRKLVSEKDFILEVGCGLGECIESMNRDFEIVGCDISYYAVKEAIGKTKIPLLVSNAEALPFKKAMFRVVLAFDVIEHLLNPEIFFVEVNRILRNDGILIFSTPNPDSFGARIKKQKYEQNGLSQSCEHELYEWFGWRDNTHINIRSITEWRKTLNESNLSIIDDGSDTLWDIPYFRIIPRSIQKLFFIPIHWVLTYFFGFFSWSFGENYICIAQKRYD